MLQILSSSVAKGIYLFAGALVLFLGIIGIFLPVLPTTPLILLAAYLFSKAHPPFRAWLYSRPVLGKPLRDWERCRAIARPIKILATGMIIISALMAATLWQTVFYAKVLLIAILALLVCYIWSFPDIHEC